MELIERPSIVTVKFLSSIKHEVFKYDCIYDADINGDKIQAKIHKDMIYCFKTFLAKQM